MWSWLKRIFLFALVNALILLTLSIAFQIVVSVFGLNVGAESTIWLWYGVLGFGGALIGLATSRSTAKWSMGVRVIDPHTQNMSERELVQMVHNLSRQAKLPAMPEVGIYDSPEINAFATGPTKARSLVAVSTGLLHNMDKDAVEGVIGHEVAHIANGDMVTMTLLQGLMNTMVLIAARVISSVLASQFEERSRPTIQMIAFFVLQFALSLLGSMVVCYFSRYREYRADAGGARLAGRQRMLAGLTALRRMYGTEPEEDSGNEAVATLKISGRSSGWMHLFSTHPPLEERIRRLESMPL